MELLFQTCEPRARFPEAQGRSGAFPFMFSRYCLLSLLSHSRDWTLFHRTHTHETKTSAFPMVRLSEQIVKVVKIILASGRQQVANYEW